MSPDNYSIRKAFEADLVEVKALADANKHELGFVLRPALAESIARGEVIIATDNVGVIGFVDYHHRKDSQTTLYHLVVTQEWQQRGVGRLLVEALRAEAVVRGKEHVLLKCPEDLEANAFYQKLGFELIRNENSRRRKLNVWRLALPECANSSQT